MTDTTEVAGVDDAKNETQPAEYEPKLIVFREVPGFDPRTLVLSYGEDAIDLQFCGCVNKYKKRFSAFLKDAPEFFEEVKAAAVKLAEQGYSNVDIKELLEYLRGKAKLETPAAQYLQKFPHDFSFDVLPRSYLVRKLMMEEAKLFNFFELSPVKCRSQCGYGHGDAPEPEAESDTDIAGF